MLVARIAGSPMRLSWRGNVGSRLGERGGNGLIGWLASDPLEACLPSPRREAAGEGAPRRAGGAAKPSREGGTRSPHA